MWLDLAVIAGTAGPVIVVLWLLNRRDRRQAALETAIVSAVAAVDRHPELAGNVAIWVDVGLWRRARVTLDMRLCEACHAWPMVERFVPLVPPRTTLRVLTTKPAGRAPASITVVALTARAQPS